MAVWSVGDTPIFGSRPCEDRCWAGEHFHTFWCFSLEGSVCLFSADSCAVSEMLHPVSAFFSSLMPAVSFLLELVQQGGLHIGSVIISVQPVK